jgi:chemotaxis signal transduction protein
VFALPVSAVREVVRDAPRRRLPGGGGVVSVRGSLVALVDLGAVLARGPVASLDGDVLLLEDGAVVVERVVGIRELAEVLPAPVSAGAVVAGLAEVDGALVVVLDPAVLVPPPAPSPAAAAQPASAIPSPAAATAPTELVLDEADGWDAGNVDFLAGMPDLRVLRIRHRRIRDVSGIHTLHALRELEVHTRCRTPIHADAFPEVERLALRWRPRARSVFEHTGLRELELTHYAAPDLRALRGMTSLEHLTLVRGVVERLDGIEDLPALRSLRLVELRRLRSLAGAEKLDVAVRNCPGVA